MVAVVKVVKSRPSILPVDKTKTFDFRMRIYERKTSYVSQATLWVVCASVGVCVSVYVCVDEFLFAFWKLAVCVSICARVGVFLRVYVGVFVFVSICMCRCLCTWLCVCLVLSMSL